MGSVRWKKTQVHEVSLWDGDEAVLSLQMVPFKHPDEGESSLTLKLEFSIWEIKVKASTYPKG